VIAQSSKHGTTEQAVEGDNEEVIHIDPPEDSVNKVTGEGVEHKEFHNRRTSSEADGGFAEEHGYNAPILASDEAHRRGEWQQPAVSPGLVPDRRGSAQFDDVNHLHRHLSHLGSATSSRHGSRSGSRPGSIHGLPPLTKMISHDEHEERYTPLEDVEEYEPLFPDDDGKAKKPMTQAERLKRRPDMKQRFPSQDIWEDTPNSLQLEAEVTSPEPFDERTQGKAAAAPPVFETPDQEAARKEAAGTGNENNFTLTPTQELLAKAGFKQGGGKGDGGAIHRFPSRDIWEDSPDHAELTTTVEGPQEEEEATKETTGVHPRVPPRPTRTKSGDILDNSAHPKVPPRPPKKQLSTDSGEGETRKPPSIPDRPKPNVPLRPNKSTSRDSNENAPLTKTVSAGSTGSIEEEGARQAKPAPPTKPKPMVPSRPVGGKIAALQAGFMADLNSRLKVGPREQQPAPKAEEPPEEKAPLQDARKGRARGPARRKPAAHSASPQPAAAKGSQLSLSAVWTVWQSDAHGHIEVSAGADSSGNDVSVEEMKPEPAEFATPPKVTDEAAVVEEPNAISKQSSMDDNDATPAGDNETELPVLSETEGVIVEGSEAPAPTASETTPAPADPAAPSSIATDDSHTGLGGAQAGNVKAVPDADEVAKASVKDSIGEAEAETVQESPVKKPEMHRRTTDEALMQAESAKDEHIEAEN
jgi:Altered inheritance of mitochondria protein 21